MAKVFRTSIEKNRCKGCELCTRVCPKQVLAMSKDINDKGYFYSTVVDQAACIGCRFCAFQCPDVAIELSQEDAG
ncbi:4Fe-4S dicluster domain-containing protein [candidate division WOR-3 bacterium]|nr:4Fe-4S dicluster domain-containing protein [candidate division WOR-3 bacterium]